MRTVTSRPTRPSRKGGKPSTNKQLKAAAQLLRSMADRLDELRREIKAKKAAKKQRYGEIQR